MRKLYFLLNVAIIGTAPGYASALKHAPVPPGTPTFALIAPLCQCSIAPPLPTVSMNGYTGTWSPSSIDSCIAGTTTYVFTPEPGQDATTASLDVVIFPTPVAPATISYTYCQNSIASPLQAMGQNVLWYNTASGGLGNVEAPIPSTALPGTTIFYASQSVNGCESPRAATVVTVVPAPQLGLFCAGSLTPSSLTFDWTPAAGSTNYMISYSIDGNPEVTLADSFASNYTVSGLSPGQFVTITVMSVGGMCEVIETITCATLGLDQFADHAMGVAPNPVHDVLRFTSGIAGTVRIFDIAGRLAGIFPVTKEGQQISMSFLRAGLYFVECASAEGIQIFKVVKI